MKKLLLPVLVAVALAGCGGDGDEKSDPAPSAAPEPVTVTVAMTDSPPLEVLQNGDGGVCSSKNIAAALFGEDTAPVEVVLRDADGSIVATETLPDRGGTMTDSTCEWNVEFEVDESPFYEATVSAPSGETSATGKSEDGAAVIAVTL